MTPEEQLAELTRGVVDLHVREDLLERLRESQKTGRPRASIRRDPISTSVTRS